MRSLIITFVILSCCLLVYAIPFGYTAEGVDEVQDIPPLPFTKGERLTYEVRYKNFMIGKSILTFHGQTELGGKKVYHITFFTRIPSFKDTEQLYADKDTFLPLEVHRTIKKTVGFSDRIYEKYDQESFRVDIKQKSMLRSKNFSIEKDSAIHNAILLTYYYRTMEDPDSRDRFKITLPTVEFEVIFEGKEVIETPLGEYLAYVFTSIPPRFKLWLSTDKERIPLKIESPATLGYSLVIKSIDKRPGL